MRFPALLLAFGLLAPAQALAAACAGSSMLADIERERPELWKKTLDDLGEIPNSTGLFWKIAKEGTAPSWLLGTIHVPDAEITAFRPAVIEAFAKSDRLVLEVAGLFGDGGSALVEKILPITELPEGENFDSGFTTEQTDSLAEMTAAVGMPYFTARRLKPWFLAITLAMPPCVHLAILRGEPGVDDKLQRDAEAVGKPVVGLETIDEQVAALASLEKAVGPEGLLEIVELGPEKIADMFATLLESYVQERPSLDIVLTLNMPELRQSAEIFRAIEGALLHDRNLRMRDRLLPILEQGRAFVGVGALHLPGDDGLVELLRASGYTVTRVE